MDRREIVLREIFLYHHAVHRGRCAKGRDAVFLEKRKYIRRVEAVEIVGEYRAFAHPLTVELAPERLAPSGIGYREVELASLDAVPIFRGNEMSERVFVGVLGDLRIACRARGEEHEHRIVSAGGILRPLVLSGEELVLAVEIVPAISLTSGKNLCANAGAALAGAVDLVGKVSVVGTDYRRDLSRVEAVFEIVLLQEVRRGYNDRAELVKSEDREPELIVTLQHKHYLVAALDAERGEVIRALGRCALHIREGEAAFVFQVVEVEHRKSVGVLRRERVHDIKGKVEAVRVHEFDRLGRAVFVFDGLYEILRNKLFAPSRRGYRLRYLLLAGLVLAAHYDREKLACLSVDCDHSVRGGAVVVY